MKHTAQQRGTNFKTRAMTYDFLCFFSLINENRKKRNLDVEKQQAAIMTVIINSNNDESRDT